VVSLQESLNLRGSKTHMVGKEGCDIKTDGYCLCVGTMHSHLPEHYHHVKTCPIPSLRARAKGERYTTGFLALCLSAISQSTSTFPPNSPFKASPPGVFLCPFQTSTSLRRKVLPLLLLLLPPIVLRPLPLRNRVTCPVVSSQWYSSKEG